MSGARAQQAGRPAFGADGTQGSQGTGDVLASIRRMIANEGTDAAPLGTVDVLRLDAGVAVPVSDGFGEAGAGREAALRWADAADARAAAAAGLSDLSFGEVVTVDAVGSMGVEVAGQGAVGGIDIGPGDEPLTPPAWPIAAEIVPNDPEAAILTVQLPADEPVTPNFATEAGMAETTLTATALPTTAEASDDEGSSLLTTIIRDVIRQELGADGSGQSAREMRAMILREVARVLTAPSGLRSV